MVDEIEVKNARDRITTEFINGYYDFIHHEIKNGMTKEFGKKYGFILRDEETIKKHSKDTLKNLMWYQQTVFSGRWLQGWEKEGYNRSVIWKLHDEGFLSLNEYSNWNARATGCTLFFFISQKVAREIYKTHRP